MLYVILAKGKLQEAIEYIMHLDNPREYLSIFLNIIT